MSVSEKIAIYYETHIVGLISIHEGGQISFAYDQRWLATSGSFPLSVTLPLVSGDFSDEVISPWLANLLPEEQQLTAIAQALRLSASDALAILREIGGDTAGAISVGEASNSNEYRYETLQEHYGSETGTAALRRHFDDLVRRPFLVNEDGVRLSLAGGQTKTALAVLDDDGQPKLGLPDPEDRLAIPKTGAPSTIIIKPDNPTLPGIVENEMYCLTLAGLIGIEAVDCSLVKAGDRTALAVARYDRLLRRNGSVRRLHQEDFAQANGIYPERKYEQGTLPGLDLKGILTTRNHLPPKQALKLVDQVIFNILVANTDAHAKNYSMILSGDVAMAPLYDVASALHWSDVNQHFAQKIAGRRRKPRDIMKRHWEQIAEDAGLNSREIVLRVRKLAEAMAAAKEEAVRIVAGQDGASEKTVLSVAGMIERNALLIAR
jgi:serine/threonine-protein kinase HipA